MKIIFRNRHFNISFGILLSFVLFSTSCSMQKRKYVKGFYIEHISKKQDNKRQVNYADVEEKYNPVNQYLASSTNKIELVAENKILITTIAPINVTCDTIYFTNGVKMLAKVISAGQETIIYKKCDSNKDEFLNLESSKVKSIHYSSGVITDLNAAENPIDDYNKPTKPFNSAKNAEADKGVRQLEKASTWYMLSRYIGFGFIVGFIYATCAKNNLKGKEGYENEFRTARTLHILGLVLLLVMLIPIIYILVMAYLI